METQEVEERMQQLEALLADAKKENEELLARDSELRQRLWEMERNWRTTNNEQRSNCTGQWTR